VGDGWNRHAMKKGLARSVLGRTTLARTADSASLSAGDWPPGIWLVGRGYDAAPSLRCQVWFHGMLERGGRP
jgi:hypothetical protein